MQSISKILGGESDSSGILNEASDGSSLNWNTRVKGFIVCFIVGIFLSVLGSVSIFFRNFIMFAFLFSLGSICSICSTFFLMGPIRQMKKMVDPNRWVATVMALSMIILTLLAGLVWRNGGLCLLFVILQYLAMTWYSLSYIPYARSAVKSCLASCV